MAFFEVARGEAMSQPVLDRPTRVCPGPFHPLAVIARTPKISDSGLGGLVEDRIFAAKVENIAVKEKTLGQLFAVRRINPKREFFEVAPEKVVLATTMGRFWR